MTTESLVLEMKAKADQLKSELDAVNNKIKKVEGSTEDYRKENQKTEKGMDDFAGTAKKAGTVITTVSAAVVAGTAAFIAYAAAQGRAMQETQALATAAGVSVEEFKSMSFALSTVGLSAEKFGDITKDTQERIGEFVTAGTGPFQDFIETMGLTREEGVKLANEFQNLSGQEVLQEMVARMQDADKSTQQMSFALESMASDTTRLIPLLKDGGKAFEELADKASKFNVELSEEEKQQFKDLAGNVDLAQQAFFNWINNGIAPFLPLINEAGIALAEFFASQQSGSDLEDIYNNTDLIKQVKTLTQLGHLEQRLGKERQDLAEKVAVARERGTLGGLSEGFEKERARLNELSKVIRDQREAIEERNEAATEAPEIKTGTLGGDTGQPEGDQPAGGTGADVTALKEELTAYENQAQSKLEILGRQRDKEMAIAGQLAQGSQERADLERRIIEKYNADVQALSDKERAIQEKARKKAIQGIQDDLQAVEDASRTKLEKLEDDEEDQLEILKKNAQNQEEYNTLKLEIQQKYLDARKELIQSQDQETFDDETVQAAYDEELAKHQEMLANKEISEQEYQQRVKDLKAVSGIQEDLAAFAEAKKTRMDLLAEEEAEKLEKLEESNRSAEEQAALKLEIEKAYQEKKRELINEISPETYDNEIVQERYDAELEQLQEHLNSKLITEEDYYNKVNALKDKSAKDDKATTDKVVKWEGTATKKQIDQGIQLLDAVGGNSKKLFKVKQGLSAANAVMNTAEGVTDALAQQNYPSAAIIAATGAAQLSAIMSAKPEGGGGGGGGATISPSAPSVPTPSATVEDTGSTIVTIDDTATTGSERFVLEFNDDIIDVIAKKVDQSKQDGRI